MAEVVRMRRFQPCGADFRACTNMFKLMAQRYSDGLARWICMQPTLLTRGVDGTGGRCSPLASGYLPRSAFSPQRWEGGRLRNARVGPYVRLKVREDSRK